MDIPTSFLEERFFHNSRSILADFCWIFEFLLSKFNRQFPNIQFHFLPVLKAPYHSIRPRPECRGSHFIVLLILKDIPASFLENITFAQLPPTLATDHYGRNLSKTLSITLAISISQSLNHLIQPMRGRPERHNPPSPNHPITPGCACLFHIAHFVKYIFGRFCAGGCLFPLPALWRMTFIT